MYYFVSQAQQWIISEYAGSHFLCGLHKQPLANVVRPSVATNILYTNSHNDLQ